MSLPEPPLRWSTGLLLSLTLGCGCQRALPRVVQQHFDTQSQAAATESRPATAFKAGTQSPTDGGWKSTATPPEFSTNGIPLAANEAGADGTRAATTADGVAAPVTAVTTADPQRPVPGAAMLAAMAATPPGAPVGIPAPVIHQTQYLATATDRDMETLRQRLEQQTQVNTALTQAIVQLQRQTEAHHKAIVQLADELNARQARQEKVTDEILSLIDQLAGDAPRPTSAAAGGPAGAGATGGSTAAGGDKK